tara:strand:- start:1110 stop:2336 length:1227 start_codon:yes stop_codon:yes gene_type:complete
VEAALKKITRQRQKKRGTLRFLDHQRTPSGPWRIWIIRGGRGSGKTWVGSQFVLDHLRRYGKRARVGIGAPTNTDARNTCAEGETGLITIGKGEFPTYNRSLGTLEARHIDGGYVRFMGAEKPDRWNGPQWTLLWGDELSLWHRETWDQAMFGLRIGQDPRAIVTTKPRRRSWLKELEEDEDTVVTTAKTEDNVFLNAVAKKHLKRRYGGTRLGRQELLGEYLDDDENALWEAKWIDDHRVTKENVPELMRVVIAVDPAVTAKSSSDETGVAVAGKGADGDFYIFDVPGYRLSPFGWASRVEGLYSTHKADAIIAEVNNGGDLVESNIRQIDRNLPVKTIHASRGKIVRAEPVALLYEKGRVHHVGVFEEVEDQMLTNVDDLENDDRRDAIVYAITELMDAEDGVFII